MKLNWVCDTCAQLCGKTAVKPNSIWRRGKCDICKKETAVTSKQSFTVFSPQMVATVKAFLKSQDQLGPQPVEPADVRKLIAIVEGVLGDNTSFMTKKIIKELKERLEKGKRIEEHDTKQLAYWYAKDVSMLKEHEAVEG
jgi:hypothetical protein